MSKNSRSGSTADCLTIELAMDAVRVAEVQQRPDARVAHSAVESLPRDLWGSLADRRQELAGAIKRAVAGSGTSRRRAVVSLPRQLVMVRLARLPRADAAQMRGLVAFEAQQHILFPIDDVVLDYAQVKETSITEANTHDDLQPVLLAAAQRRIINEVMAAVAAAGLSVERLTVSTLALAEHARESTGTIAVVTAEPAEAQVSVVADGAPLFSRAANLPQATDLNALETDLAGEIARSLAAFSTEFRQARIDAVWLAGSAAAAPGGSAMAQRLESVLELPVTILQSPLVRAGDHEGIRCAVSVGAAAQDGAQAIAGVNLMPQDEIEHRRRRRQALAGRLSIAGFAVALVVVVALARAWLVNSAAEHKADLAANNELAQSQKALGAVQAAHDADSAITTDMASVLDYKHPAVDVITAVGAALATHKDLWLTQFAFDRKSGVVIQGECKSALAATGLLIQLQRTGAFTDVQLGYLRDAAQQNGGAPVNSPATSAPVQQSVLPGGGPLPGMTNRLPTSSPAAPAGAGASTGNPRRRRFGGFPGGIPSGGGGFGGTAFMPGGFGGNRRRFGGGRGPGGGAPTASLVANAPAAKTGAAATPVTPPAAAPVAPPPVVPQVAAPPPSPPTNIMTTFQITMKLVPGATIGLPEPPAPRPAVSKRTASASAHSLSTVTHSGATPVVMPAPRHAATANSAPSRTKHAH